MWFVLSKEEAITWWYSAYCIYQVSGTAAQQLYEGREGAERGSDKLFPNMKEKTFKMFVLELFFWLMFNLSLFQSNVLVISSIAEGHI